MPPAIVKRTLSAASLFLLVGVASLGCETAPDGIGESAAAVTGSRVVNLAIGPSVPAQDSNWNISSVVTAQGGDLTRHTGGEVIAFKFFNADSSNPVPVRVTKIRLIGFSRSGRGQVLVRSFSARPEMPNGTFDRLTNFASISSDSHAKNHDGMVMLGAGDSVTFIPTRELTLTHFLPTLEAFADDDASVDVQVELSSDAANLAVTFARVLVGAEDHSGGGGGGGGGGTSTHPGSGHGDDSGNTNEPTGTGSCHGDGQSCTFDGDCCNHDCVGAHSCRVDSHACQGAGGSCTFDGECCNHDCVAGECKRGMPSCTALTFDSCQDDSECCGGNSCRNGICE